MWVNEEWTVMVRLLANGTAIVTLRASPDDVWGPPIVLSEAIAYGEAPNTESKP